MKYKKAIINILIIMGFMLIVSANVLIQPFSNLDEIWIYNFGRCVVNGLLPYKDFSIIITPLFPYISAGFLKLFGNEMIVLRYAEIIQTALILFLIYKILERLKVNKGISLLCTLGVYYLYSKSFCFDYNWAVLLVSLIILYIELKEENNVIFHTSNDLWIGVLAGISILLKQTSGIVLSAVVVSYKFFESTNKEEFKQAIRIFFSRILGVLLPILLFAVYLTFNNLWNGFIDYAILGINTFSNTVSYARFLSEEKMLTIVMTVFFIIVILASLITRILKKTRKAEWTINLRTLMFWNLASAIVIYPITDKMHFAVATICTIITIIYLINTAFISKVIVNSEKAKRGLNIFCYIISGIVFAILIVNSVLNIGKYFDSLEGKKYLNHFKYIETSENLYNTLSKYGEYISSKKQDVIILDAVAAAVNIPLDKYYKNYDMFNKGNFGANGEQRNNRRT